jgi:CTP synthase
MRLGGYDCELVKGSQAAELYEGKVSRERHRHRYEVNPDYREQLENKGFKVVGTNPQTGLIEIMELEGHPYFIGTQAHPEFRSRLLQPSPLFKGLIAAAKKNCEKC